VLDSQSRVREEGGCVHSGRTRAVATVVPGDVYDCTPMPRRAVNGWTFLADSYVPTGHTV